MVHGSFLPDRDLPTVQVAVGFGQTVLFPTFILDTGFSGDLKVDRQTADDLGIEVQGMTYTDNANGERVLVGMAHGYAEMENKKKPISILVAPGAHLAGMGLFKAFGYTVVVDAKNKTTHLEASR